MPAKTANTRAVALPKKIKSFGPDKVEYFAVTLLLESSTKGVKNFVETMASRLEEDRYDYYGDTHAIERYVIETAEIKKDEFDAAHTS